MIFGFVSKKKYAELEEKYKSAREALSDKRFDARMEVEEKARLVCQLKQSMEENIKLREEVCEYKKKYADEVQKRLALVETITTHKETEGEG